jgi:hypothetical protein
VFWAASGCRSKATRSREARSAARAIVECGGGAITYRLDAALASYLGRFR